MTGVMAMGVLADKFHSIYRVGMDSKSIVFHNTEEVKDRLRELDISYKEHDSLLFVPLEDAGPLFEADEELESKIELYK